MFKQIALAAAAVSAIALTGCGVNTTGTNPYDYNSDYNSGTGYDYNSGTNYDYNSGYNNNTGYGTNTGYNNGYNNYPQTTLTGNELVVNNVQKDKSGILLWKKLTVSAQVRNNSQMPVSGEVRVEFTKGGKLVDTQYEYVTDLAPGQSQSFSLKSKNNADDANITVTAQPSASATTGYNTNTGYNTGYNTNTGYGTNTGYTGY